LATYQDPGARLKNQIDIYTYNTTHGLKGIQDPLGDTPIRNDYDDSGRMTDSIDAYGNKIFYNYNLAANSESVTNRNNQPTSYLYDNNGNVLSETQYLNGTAETTTYTYSQDGYNNKLTELLPGNSNPTRYQYNDPNNPRLPTSVSDPDNNTTNYTYDSLGHTLTTKDPKGNVATNTYDSNGNLKTSQSAQDQTPSSYTYDSNGNMLSQTDPAGIVTQYTYDGSGNMLSQTVAYGLPEALTTSYTYDANGNRVTETKQNPSGSGNQTTLYTYDTNNRLVETFYPDGTNTQTIYDSLGHVVGTIDQKQRQTNDFYDAMGRAATIQYPDNRMSVYGYDPNGNRTDDTEYGTDGSSRNTHTDYDSLNHPVTVTYPDTNRTISVYDGQGRVTDSYDENGSHTHYDYDNAGRRLDMIAGVGSINQESQYGYDANGNQTTLTVAGQLQSTTGYDTLNRATTVTYPQPAGQAYVNPSITVYDADGRKTQTIDQAQNVTNFSYDGQGRLTNVTKVSSSGNMTETYTYDQVGNLLSQMDSNNHTTYFTYDAMNRRKSRTLPDGRTQSYTTYDATGNLTNYTDLAGNAFTNSYSPLNDKLTSVSGPGVNESYSYDNFLRRYSFTDPTGTTTFNYDARDRMVTQIGPTGTKAFTYMPNGQVYTDSSTDPNGDNLTYVYDGLNRPTTILDGAKTTTISYDAFSNLTVINMPNGVAVTQTYDSLNRKTGISIEGGSATLGSYQYTLGPAGNRLSVNEYNNNRNVQWTYDNLYRLTGENIANDPGNNGNIGYIYDPVGNRNQRTSSITPISAQNFTGGYNPADLLKPTFSFDQNGNQTSDSQGRTYSYNTLNQLTHVTGTTLDVSYLYDGDGLRTQKTNNTTGVTTSYLWDRNNLTGYPQVTKEFQNSQLSRRYVYGPESPLYMVQLVGGSWVTSYYGKDAQNVRFLMSDSGQITDSYTWDAFGNLISSSGAGTANNIGFDGEYADSDTGLIYLRARWMNPTIGRFMGMDTDEGDNDNPISLNKYIFVGDDPTVKNDTGGTDPDVCEVSFSIQGEAIVSANPTVRTSEATDGLDEPVIKVVQDSVYSHGRYYNKVFRAKILATNVNQRFAVVPWLRGELDKNGKRESFIHQGEPVDHIFSWEVDQVPPDNAEARGASLIKISNNEEDFIDVPGFYNAKPDGPHLSLTANLEFYVEVYDRKKLSNNPALISDFSLPSAPVAPSAEQYWDFKGTYNAY
jgi:RHS repeat-associated protein